MPRAKRWWCRRLGSPAPYSSYSSSIRRGLGPHAEPRHHPRGRVGLHEVVDRADPGQLQHLLAGRVAVHVRGDRGAVVLGDPVEEVVDEAQPGRRGEPGAQPLLEVALEQGAHPEQLRVPLEVVRHAGEVAVVQLVQHPQRERGVVRRGASGRAVSTAKKSSPDRSALKSVSVRGPRGVGRSMPGSYPLRRDARSPAWARWYDGGMTDNIATQPPAPSTSAATCPSSGSATAPCSCPARACGGRPRTTTTRCAVLRRAVELGITFFDTADSYGPETRRGAAQGGAAPVRRRRGDRDQGRADPAGPGHLDAGSATRPYLRQQCELSLRRLGVERIDLFQLHRIDAAYPLEDQVGELKALQDEGKIRHIGLSEVSVERDQGRPRGRRDRHRAEPLQPRRPQRPRTSWTTATARGHRLHPVVPARDRRAVQGGRPAGRGRRSATTRRRPSSRWPGCCAARR